MPDDHPVNAASRAAGSDQRGTTRSSTAESTSLADRIRVAYEHRDLEAFAELLDPDVRWGPPGSATPPCRNRQQVIAWYGRSMAGGLAGAVTSLREIGDRLLLGLSVERDGEPATARWQVLSTNGELVTAIAGFDNESEAIQYARTGTTEPS
jgi:hypothetical protein